MSRLRTAPTVANIGLIPPSPSHIATLPLEYRWEAIRRHPYYLCFWEAAKRFHEGALDDNERNRMVGINATHILNMIGVSGPPVNPGTSFEELGKADLHPAWLSGAVRPVSPRALAVFLLSRLPEGERQFLSNLFSNSVRPSSQPEQDEQHCVRQALLELSRYESSLMDSWADTPFYFLQMEASQRTLTDDMVNIDRYWKKRHRIEERRIRADKFPDYFQMWDCREGWTDAGYTRKAETPYKEIAKILKQPISSIHNSYRAAFELITGHEFSPECWSRLFGPIKFSELFTSPADHYLACYRRTTSYASRRPVPESVVSPNAEVENRSSFVDQQKRYFDDTASTDVLIDIQTRAGQGQSNAEIARTLKLSVKAVSDILTALADRRTCSI